MALPRNSDDELIGWAQSLWVKEDAGILKSLLPESEMLQFAVMSRADDFRTSPVQEKQNRFRQSRTLNWVSSRTEFVKQNQRFIVSPCQHLRYVAHVA